MTLSVSYPELTTAPDDEANKITLQTDTGTLPARTTWTLLLYLTSSADGW
jgi:hypothetical protein